MRVYKILHIPSGLFWKPSKHNSKYNLSKKGKIYYQKPTGYEKWLGNTKYGYTYREAIKDYPYSKITQTKPEDWKIIEYEMEPKL